MSNDTLVVGVEVPRNIVVGVVISGKISRAGGLSLAGIEGVAFDGAAGRGAALPGGVRVVAALLGLGLAKFLVAGRAGSLSSGVAEGELDICQGLRPLPPDGVGGVRGEGGRAPTLALPLLAPGEGPLLLLGQHGQLGPHEAMREPGPRQPVLHEGAGQG